MALNGTTDLFPLADVLRFLGSTGKTGCLDFAASTGSGTVMFADGNVVSITTSAPLPGAEPTERLFSLLRMGEGEFSFEAGEVPSGNPVAVDALLHDATILLDRWPELATVVPSLDTAIALTPQPPAESVTLSADQWELVVHIAGGATAASLGTQLQIGEFVLSKALSELHHAGLITIATPAVPTEEADDWGPPAVETPSQVAVAAVAAPADTISFTADATPVERLVNDPWGDVPPATPLDAGAVSPGEEINRSRFFKLLQNAKQ
jgi:hypothetical protein